MESLRTQGSGPRSECRHGRVHAPVNGGVSAGTRRNPWQMAATATIVRGDLVHHYFEEAGDLRVLVAEDAGERPGVPLLALVVASLLLLGRLPVVDGLDPCLLLQNRALDAESDGREGPAGDVDLLRPRRPLVLAELIQESEARKGPCFLSHLGSSCLPKGSRKDRTSPG